MGEEGRGWVGIGLLWVDICVWMYDGSRSRARRNDACRKVLMSSVGTFSQVTYSHDR